MEVFCRNGIIRQTMPTNKQTALVTGAAGFLGSHLVDALLSKGYQVLGVDNFITGSRDNLKNALSNQDFVFIQGDVIASPDSYLPEDEHIDVTFHLASPASPPRYQQHPIETYLVNSLGTHQLLQYFLEKNPDVRFVYASTSEAYGDPEQHPQKETYWGHVNPNGIRSCYDESKRFGEMVCGVHSRDMSMNIRIMRIFNTFGPRMNPADGRVIPNFITQALHNNPLTIYGDGSQTRSFCYVDDLIEGMILFAESPRASGLTINLGNPVEKTMLELALLIKEQTDSKSKIIYQELPGDDPTKRCPDISKAKEVLGWEPKTTFEEGLQKTIEYFRKT